MTTQPQISEASLALFLELAKAQQGNLTQLKQAGLLTTQEDDDAGRRCMSTGKRLPPCVFVFFTAAGVALGAEHGFSLEAL